MFSSLDEWRVMPAVFTYQSLILYLGWTCSALQKRSIDEPKLLAIDFMLIFLLLWTLPSRKATLFLMTTTNPSVRGTQNIVEALQYLLSPRYVVILHSKYIESTLGVVGSESTSIECLEVCLSHLNIVKITA